MMLQESVYLEDLQNSLYAQTVLLEFSSLEKLKAMKEYAFLKPSRFLLSSAWPNAKLVIQLGSVS